MSTIEAMQRDFADFLCGQGQSINAHVAPDALIGLDVYAGNYCGTLIAALRESFERVHSWLGDANFDAAAEAHMAANPPKSWTLNAYGANFADTLDKQWPDDPEVAELARLDWALRRAFDGPDEAVIGPAEAASVDWETALIRPVKTLHLLDFQTNAAAIWSALDQDADVPGAECLDNLVTVRVWRQGLQPQFCTIDQVEVLALDLIRDGAAFGFLCETLAKDRNEELAVSQAGEMLGRWLNEGLIAEVTAG